MITKTQVCHDFFSVFLVVGFTTEKYARMDVWHYHLEATENSDSEEDLPEGFGGLS